MRVGRGVVLRFGLSLGFGGGIGTRVRVRVRAGIRVRTGIGGRIRIGRCWGRGNVASSFVPLHVPHTSDGLDLRHRGSPVVPVLEITVFKDILAPPVARIHISNPPAKRERKKEWRVARGLGREKTHQKCTYNRLGLQPKTDH